jgi:hypothetical protein
MTLNDLFFLASFLAALGLCCRIAYCALRRRWDAARRSARWLGLFAAGYAAVLMAVALALPRRFYAPGERRCFDDWCVAALGAKALDAPADPPCQPGQGGRVWVAEVEVSSVALRVRQRARDARVELEDRQGRRYQPCAEPLPAGGGQARLLSDELGPGGSFRVAVPFRLPEAASPAGLAVHHGDFPGRVIIGADQSFPHAPALQRLALERR